MRAPFARGRIRLEGELESLLRFRRRASKCESSRKCSLCRSSRFDELSRGGALCTPPIDFRTFYELTFTSTGLKCQLSHTENSIVGAYKRAAAVRKAIEILQCVYARSPASPPFALPRMGARAAVNCRAASVGFDPDVEWWVDRGLAELVRNAENRLLL